MKHLGKALCILLLLATTATLAAAPVQDDQGIVKFRSWWTDVVEQVSWVLTTLSSCTGPECPAGGGNAEEEQGQAPTCAPACTQSEDPPGTDGQQ